MRIERPARVQRACMTTYVTAYRELAINSCPFPALFSLAVCVCSSPVLQKRRASKIIIILVLETCKLCHSMFITLIFCSDQRCPTRNSSARACHGKNLMLVRVFKGLGLQYFAAHLEHLTIYKREEQTTAPIKPWCGLL